MDKEKVVYKEFTSSKRKITLCFRRGTSRGYETFYIGMSICNPDDIKDKVLGRKIAYSRAVVRIGERTPNIFSASSDRFVLNNMIIDSILEVQKDRITNNPEKYIKVSKL